MSFDLLSSLERFSHLDIYVSEKFPLSDIELQTQYGFTPKRMSFFDIPKTNDSILFLRAEECSLAETLKSDCPGIFLLGFSEGVSESLIERLKHHMLFINSEPSTVVHKLELIEAIIRERKKVSLLKEAQGHSAQLFKEASQYINELDKEGINQLDSILSSFLSIERGTFDLSNTQDFFEHLKKHFSSLELWDEMLLSGLDAVVKKKEQDECWRVFPLDWLGLSEYLIYRPVKGKNKEVSFAISLFLEAMEKFIAFKGDELSRPDRPNLWVEAMSELPLPLALINLNGDLLVYNQRFTKLNFPPRECLSLQNEEAIEIGKDFFKVRRLEIEKDEGNLSLFLFINKEKLQYEKPDASLKTISSQELGIISSSIAHELNNPLAGILAAISILELEDWEEDDGAALSEMKTSARRCKTLVEIFLGFSRAKDKEQRQGTLREALGQALDLLRFRMIESDIRIEVDVEASSDPFKRYVNLSLGSMIIYLVLGDILTLFNHHRLVIGQADQKTLCTTYKEESDRVLFNFPKDMEIHHKLNESKLMKYLVDILGLEMEVESNRIILHDWKLL